MSKVSNVIRLVTMLILGNVKTEESMKNKTKNFPIQLLDTSAKEAGLCISKKALAILSTTPPQEKGARKTKKRLVRIRKNLFRELEAMNKELRRHRVEIVIL